jgi:REP element-mobilizing transposase RayT
MLKSFYRRQLPHLQRDNKQHFLTFCTFHRWVLPEQVRSVVLDSCLHDDGSKIDLQVAVIMPDHVHLIFTPLVNGMEMTVWPLAEITDAIKGASAHMINRVLGRKEKVWQAESFDHVVRSSESLDQKIQYVLENPVRRGLVGRGGRIILGPGASRAGILFQRSSCGATLRPTAEGGCPHVRCEAAIRQALARRVLTTIFEEPLRSYAPPDSRGRQSPREM